MRSGTNERKLNRKNNSKVQQTENISLKQGQAGNVYRKIGRISKRDEGIADLRHIIPGGKMVFAFPALGNAGKCNAVMLIFLLIWKRGK